MTMINDNRFYYQIADHYIPADKKNERPQGDKTTHSFVMAKEVTATGNTPQKPAMIYPHQVSTLKKNVNHLENEIRKNQALINNISSINKQYIRITESGKVKGYDKNISHFIKKLMFDDYNTSIDKAKAMSEKRSNKSIAIETHLSELNNCKRKIITDIKNKLSLAAAEKYHNVFTRPYHDEAITDKSGQVKK